MMVNGYDEVAGRAVLIGAGLPHTSRGVSFEFLKCFGDSFFVSLP